MGAAREASGGLAPSPIHQTHTSIIPGPLPLLAHKWVVLWQFRANPKHLRIVKWHELKLNPIHSRPIQTQLIECPEECLGLPTPTPSSWHKIHLIMTIDSDPAPSAPSPIICYWLQPLAALRMQCCSGPLAVLWLVHTPLIPANTRCSLTSHTEPRLVTPLCNL